MKSKKTSRKLVEERLAGGELTQQKSWSFIRELNSYSEERLDALALTGGKRDYTYRQMFRQWDRYAEVFSALGITEENYSRVGMVSVAAVEPVLAFYALNMTGASVSMVHIFDLMDEDRWEKLVLKEGITDVVLCDQQIMPDVLSRVVRNMDKLGIRNVIVLHNTVGGSDAPQGMELLSNLNYFMLKRCSGALFMDELLQKYEATPIVFGRKQSSDDALIIHTSGTTSGIHKPIPLSDSAFNEAVTRLLRDERFAGLREKAVSYLAVELASSYGVIDMMHLTFAFSGTLVTLPIPPFDIRYAESASKYGVNVLFATNVMLDKCIKSKKKFDLSDLSFVFIGGGYISTEMKKRYNEYLKSCGAKIGASNGYGLSEAGGACILSDPCKEDDSIGYPLSGVKVRIYDEDEEKFYTLDDGPRRGVLFISTPSMSCGRIDSEVFFELDEIEGETYLNTYDLVVVNEDGSMTCIGRMNKYFVNNEGIRFNAGLVETAVAAQPGIEACGLAPVYDKTIHDTTSVIYIQTTGDQADAIRTVREALCNVFIRDNMISETNMPGQCVITTHIPYTTTGKVDVYSILKGETPGTLYKVAPIRKDGKLTDIGLDIAHDDELGAWAGAPEELGLDQDYVNKVLGKSASKKEPDTAKSDKKDSARGIDQEMIRNLLRHYITWIIEEGKQNVQDRPQPNTDDMFESVMRMIMQFVQNMPPMNGQDTFMQQGMGCQQPHMNQQNPWFNNQWNKNPWWNNNPWGQSPWWHNPWNKHQWNHNPWGQPPHMNQKNPWFNNPWGQNPWWQNPWVQSLWEQLEWIREQVVDCQPDPESNDSQSTPDLSKIMDLLAKLFNASTFSSFYEE